MHIANPMYDVVFKYLMEDNDIAKLIISTILSEDIVELDFLPQESTMQLEHHPWTVYRLDFSATIKKPDGTMKQIIIEIQKAKFAADIMRFRRYVGAQYQNKEHTYTVKLDGKDTKRAMPIVSIYFLGYPLEHTTAPVIHAARTYYDVTTGEEIPEREEFIESLTHDSYVIQIPHLRPEHKTDIEWLLSVFDQHYAIPNDVHVLNIDDEDYPEKYRAIIRRLQKAIAEPVVRSTMDGEDDILEELENLERAIQRRDETIEEQGKTLEANQKTIEEQQRLIEELQQRLNQDE